MRHRFAEILDLLVGCSQGQATQSSGAGSGRALSTSPKLLRFGSISSNWPKDGIVSFSAIGTVSNNDDRDATGWRSYEHALPYLNPADGRAEHLGTQSIGVIPKRAFQ